MLPSKNTKKGTLVISRTCSNYLKRHKIQAPLDSFIIQTKRGHIRITVSAIDGQNISWSITRTT